MVDPSLCLVRWRRLGYFLSPGAFRWQLWRASIMKSHYSTNSKSVSRFDNISKKISFNERYRGTYQDDQRNQNRLKVDDRVVHWSNPAYSAEIVDNNRDPGNSSNQSHSEEPYFNPNLNIRKKFKLDRGSFPNVNNDPQNSNNDLRSSTLKGLVGRLDSLDQFQKSDGDRFSNFSKTPVKNSVDDRLTGPGFDSRQNSHGDKLISLFQNTITQPNKTTETTYYTLASKNVKTLNAMIENSSISESWNFFLENFGPNSPQTSSSLGLKQAISNLIKEIITSKQINPYDSSVPSIKEIANITFQLGFLSCTQWADLVTALLEKVSTIKGNPVDDKLLVLDIISAWDVATRKSKPSDHLSPLEIKAIYEKDGIDALFGTTVPNFQGDDLSNVPLVAIATFSVLIEALTTLHDQSHYFMSLLKSIAALIDVPNLDISPLRSRKNNAVIKSFIFNNWTEIRERACQLMGSFRRNEDESETKSHDTENSQVTGKPPSFAPIRGLVNIHHKIHSAIILKNHSELDELWSEVSQWSKEDSEHDSHLSGRNGFISQEICNQFIMAYMKFQRPAKAIEVWRHMISKGLSPTLKSWNVMLSGCRSTSDWKSSEKIWKMMIYSGLKPDVISWANRLNVLMDSNQIDMGIKLLDEMAQLWLSTAEKTYPNMNLEQLLLVKKIEDAAKPDASCMNIVVAGILRRGNMSRANQIINWARNFGIRPNTATYNTILRPLVRQGNTRQAMSILKRMEVEGIEADVITFTIILDELLRFPGQYEPEKLKEIISGIFMNMDRANVRPNSYTYGKIIHQLVRDLNRNYSPIVDLVMQRMLSKGIQPSVQLYTNLLEYYLLQNPPNMEMARQIIDSATSIIGLDRTFWDTVIDCYARLGETTTALNIMARLSSKKLRIGWFSLGSLLQALLTKKEWHQAKELIRDVQMNSTQHDYKEKTKGEELFWELALRVDALNI